MEPVYSHETRRPKCVVSMSSRVMVLDEDSEKGPLSAARK
jgi:hypothetical protein